jgi:hypothetical protein
VTPAKASVSRMLDFEMPIRERSASLMSVSVLSRFRMEAAVSELLRPLIAVALLAELSSISAAAAGQQLLPVPYPEMLGPNAQIGGTSPGTSAHEHLLPDPVPQSLGPNALGNPRPWHRHRHKHLLPTPYWRQYHRWR